MNNVIPITLQGTSCSFRQLVYQLSCHLIVHARLRALTPLAQRFSLDALVVYWRRPMWSLGIVTTIEKEYQQFQSFFVPLSCQDCNPQACDFSVSQIHPSCQSSDKNSQANNKKWRRCGKGQLRTWFWNVLMELGQVLLGISAMASFIPIQNVSTLVKL